MPKFNFFAWLLLVDRLNTRDILRRRKKHLEEGYLCSLCHDQVNETILHLFFECQSSTARWFLLGIQWLPVPDICQKLQHQKEIFTGPYFMDLFTIAAWCIWKERNEFIFNNKAPRLSRWKRVFRVEVVLHLHRLPQHKRVQKSFQM